MSEAAHKQHARRVGFAEFARDPVHWFALGFGSGLSPKAPGTAGTAAALPLHLLLMMLPPWLHGTLLAAGLVGGVWICGESARRLDCHDHPAIVWDEIVPFLMLLFVLPQGWAWWLAAFVAFRFFDVLKPWPIRELDHRLAGGVGIMLDDVIAAVFAWLLLVPVLLYAG